MLIRSAHACLGYLGADEEHDPQPQGTDSLVEETYLRQIAHNYQLRNTRKERTRRTQLRLGLGLAGCEVGWSFTPNWSPCTCPDTCPLWKGPRSSGISCSLGIRGSGFLERMALPREDVVCYLTRSMGRNSGDWSAFYRH